MNLAVIINNKKLGTMTINHKVAIFYTRLNAINVKKALMGLFFVSIYLILGVSVAFAQENSSEFYIAKGVVISGTEFIHTNSSNNVISEVDIKINSFSSSSVSEEIFISNDKTIVYIYENTKISFNENLHLKSFNVKKKNASNKNNYNLVSKSKNKNLKATTKKNVETFYSIPFSDNLPLHKKTIVSTSSTVVTTSVLKKQTTLAVFSPIALVVNTCGLFSQKQNNHSLLQKSLIAYTLAIKHCNRPPPHLS